MLDPDPASILLTILFVFLTILFQIADEAFSAVGEARIRELEEEGNRKARILRRLTEGQQRFASRVRISTVFCTVGIAFGLLYIFESYLHNVLQPLCGPVWGAPITYLLVAVATAFVFGFLCCLLPRRLISRNPEGVALTIAPLFAAVYVLSFPLYGLCALFAYPFVLIAGVKLHQEDEAVTEEDIREWMDYGEEAGTFDAAQMDMVNNVFEFDDITAAEIMTPRIDVIAVDVNDTMQDVLKIAVENGYSRLPVYEEDIDSVLGILYIKDLLPYVGRNLPKNVTVRNLLRDTLFVPDTKKCDELFEEMNKRHLQMAIVVDEYGGVAGIVTIEDLLESIVGNMQDEFDNEEEEITQIDDDSFEVDGNLSVNELEELLDTELPEGDYDTVAGFLLDQLGHIPEEGETAEVTYEGLSFVVTEMDDLRIENVVIKRINEDEEPEEE